MSDNNVMFKISKDHLQEAIVLADTFLSKGYNLFAEGDLANEFNKNFIATSVFHDDLQMKFLITDEMFATA